MHPKSFFRPLFLSILLNFNLLVQLSSCYDYDNSAESSEYIDEKVADFEQWLQAKLRRDKLEVPHVLPSASNSSEGTSSKSLGTSFEPPSLTYKSNQDTDKVEFRDEVIFRGQKQHLQLDEHSVVGHQHIPSEHGTIEDILYIRKFNSDSDHSMSNILDALLSHKESEDEFSISDAEEQTTDFEEDALYFESCSADVQTFNDQKICPAGTEYNIEPRFVSNYSEITRVKMEKEVVIPKHHPEDTLCNFHKHLGPNRQVRERALCPFKWIVSDSNPARLPEYLYTAKCACQVSRYAKHHIAVCTEIKSKIRVLWRIGCQDGLHRYKEGWEEIAVACVPIGQYTTRSKPAHAINIGGQE